MKPIKLSALLLSKSFYLHCYFLKGYLEKIIHNLAKKYVRGSKTIPFIWKFRSGFSKISKAIFLMLYKLLVKIQSFLLSSRNYHSTFQMQTALNSRKF
uniref:Uncharacterized protein n=1 Tax=Heterorhabditis bacteriophora TaxID=37862 RepID=A0A1I7X3J2_HETBA